MELLFFFNWEAGLLQLWITDMLSALAKVLPSKWNPNQVQLVAKPFNHLQTVFMADNSELKEEDSMEPCFLLCHAMGAIPRKMITPC